eukprot:TRINITY_DN2308_c0_g1_i1.p1 TRINITY_DN2308_c0_g1~~TRINITY_DN2308_c0_g1_i1.p1  ORF type:complete len:163 (+),score=43.89 TRINITY_DN2308_c0_g1_i1:118-606(+)
MTHPKEEFHLEHTPQYSKEELKKMNWTEKYAVGVKTIDDQHKVLFRMIFEIKQLLDWKFETEDEAHERILRVFDGLIDYSGFHFDTEEGIMAENGYIPEDFKRHKLIHDYFIQQILRFRCNVELGIADETQDLSSMLTEWLVVHIQKNDLQLGEFLNKKGVF